MKPGIVEVMESMRGRELTDAEASRLLHMQRLLGIDNNDAIWVVMLALEHYQQLYEAMPPRIEAAGEVAVKRVKETADAVAAAAAATAQSELSGELARSVREVANQTARKQQWQWIAAGLIVFTHDVVFLLALKQFAEQTDVQPLDQHVRRQVNGAGVCREELPWLAMRVKDKIGFLKNAWQAVDKKHRNGEQDAYEREAKELYGLLREAWERAVEEVLLGGIVERFRPSVETQRLAPLSDITDEDCKTVKEGMTKSSAWLTGHDHAAAARAPVPAPDELKKDIEALETWVKGINVRRSKK